MIKNISKYFFERSKEEEKDGTVSIKNQKFSKKHMTSMI